MIWFGKGKVVGTTLDGKVVADIAGRNVIFENEKQNTISAGSLKKIEIPKTNEVVEVPTEVITKNNTKKVPENMFNVILDKAKSKITDKPVAQVQLERIGVDVKVRNSGIKIDGTTRAGDKIDKIKNNLGHNFPVYDDFKIENGLGIATNTKARDITSKTYSSTEYKNGFYNRIKRDIDDILAFKDGKMKNGKNLEKYMIDKNVLEISINEHELTKQQIDNIKRSMDYAKESRSKIYHRKIGGEMKKIILVSIAKEKKIEDFRMIIMPSGRDKIGLIQTKDYGIIAYPNKNNFEKIGEMIYWGFNESDDKVIEISPNIKFHKQFYNCSSFRKVLNEYNEVWFESIEGMYKISLLRKQGNAYVIFENENKEAVEHIFPEKPTALELGRKVMEMFEYKERYDGIIE